MHQRKGMLIILKATIAFLPHDGLRPILFAQSFRLIRPENRCTSTVTVPREDHQFWNEIHIAKPITKRNDLVFIGIARIGRNWARPVDERIGAGWSFKINKYLTVMPTYIHVAYQYNNPDFTVFRNRLQIDHPAQIGQFKFKPFVADEIWYSTQSANAQQFGWFPNRITVGIIKQMTERFYGEFFVPYQSDARSRPGNIPVVGTLFRDTL